MKKGSINLTLEQIIGLVIGSILILGLIFFAISITAIFQNNPEQSTINSFDALIITINQLVSTSEVTEEGGKSVDGARGVVIKPNKGGGPEEFYADISFSMQDDYGLIGFDSEEVKQTCGGIGFIDPSLKKPSQCLKLPCLCLTKIKWTDVWPPTFRTVNNYEKCETLKGVRYIYTTKDNKQTLALNLGKQHSVKGGNNNLALWSSCGNQGSMNVKNIRVLKVKDGENIDILFANVPKG